MRAGFVPENRDFAAAVHDARPGWISASRPAVNDPTARDALLCEPV